jgi:hypothetical protein
MTDGDIAFWTVVCFLLVIAAGISSMTMAIIVIVVAVFWQIAFLYVRGYFSKEIH